MDFDWYAYEVPAIVRKKKLHRHRALLDKNIKMASVFIAQGPPRAWHLSLDSAIRGICQGIEKGEAEAEPLLAMAASQVRNCASSLIDESNIQVHGITVSIQHDTLTIAAAGSCRAYLRRKNEHRQLTQKSDTKGLRTSFSFSTIKEKIQDKDIILIGPSHVFGVSAIAQLSRHFQERTSTSARSLSRTLLSTPDAEQTGGAVVAIQVGSGSRK